MEKKSIIEIGKKENAASRKLHQYLVFRSRVSTAIPAHCVRSSGVENEGAGHDRQTPFGATWVGKQTSWHPTCPWCCPRLACPSPRRPRPHVPPLQVPQTSLCHKCRVGSFRVRVRVRVRVGVKVGLELGLGLGLGVRVRFRVGVRVKARVRVGGESFENVFSSISNA